MIDKSTIDRIMSVASVVDVITDSIQLRRCGAELTAPCPLHNGQHLGHFKVSPAKNMYYCFVCGKGGGPVDWLMQYEGLTYPDAIRYLGRKYNIYIDEEQKAPRFANVKRSEPKPITLPPELPTLTLPLEMVTARRDTSDDTLCNFIRNLPWSETQRARVEKVLEAYAVGHARNGMTIFWQIDHLGNVHTGKMMRYKTDGHRDKEHPYAKDWIHSTLARAKRLEYYNPEEQQMRPCLFGLHLIHAKDVKLWDVNIVESEKTALIMAIAHGVDKGLWMATGGMQFLKPEMLKPLFDLGVNITLHPDHDGDQRWRKRMQELGYTYGRDYQVNNWLTEIAWREGVDSPTADCADIVIRQLYDKQRSGTIERLSDIIKRNPAMGKLITTLDLVESGQQ